MNRSYFTSQMANKLNCCFYVLRTAYRLLISFTRDLNSRTRRISNSKLISIAAAKLKLFSQKPVKIRQTCSVRLSERTSAFRAEKNGSTPLPSTTSEVQGNEHAGYAETSQYASKLSPVWNRWSRSVIPSCWQNRCIIDVFMGVFDSSTIAERGWVG